MAWSISNAMMKDYESLNCSQVQEVESSQVNCLGIEQSAQLSTTPTCHNAKEGAYPSEYTRNTPSLASVIGGKIHPNFTEWMMGWPIDWTDLKPLGTVKFQLWRQHHSMF